MWRTSCRRGAGGEGGRKRVKGIGDRRSRRWAQEPFQPLQEATTKKHKCLWHVFFFFSSIFLSLRNVWMRESHTWRSCCDGVRLSKVKETDPIYSLICWGIKLHDVTLLQFDNYQHMFLISSCSETQVTQVLLLIWSFRTNWGKIPTPSVLNHTSCIYLLFLDILPSEHWSLFVSPLVHCDKSVVKTYKNPALFRPRCSVKDCLPQCVRGWLAPGMWKTLITFSDALQLLNDGAAVIGLTNDQT